MRSKPIISLVLMATTAIVLAGCRETSVFTGQKQRRIGTQAKINSKLTLDAIMACSANPDNHDCLEPAAILNREDSLSDVIENKCSFKESKECVYVSGTNTGDFVIHSQTAPLPGYVTYEYRSTGTPHRVCSGKNVAPELLAKLCPPASAPEMEMW